MTRDLTRLALALNEVASAILELSADEAPATVTPPPVAVLAPAAQTFAATPQPAAAPAGQCPIHHTPWKTTKRDGSGAKRAYCPQKMADGSYCEEKGPWLTQPPFAS